MTEILPLETPVLVARGQDPLPSGFDAVNSGVCTFTEPVAKVTLELLRDGDVVHSQSVAIEPADSNVRFPISAANKDPVPSNLALGSYDRRIEAAVSVNGVTAEVRFDPNWVSWIRRPSTKMQRGNHVWLFTSKWQRHRDISFRVTRRELISWAPISGRDWSPVISAS